MGLLAALLLVELSCATTLFYEGRWGMAIAILVVMGGQVVFALSSFQEQQRRRRMSYVVCQVLAGKTWDVARMSAHYHYPDLRVFARMAAHHIQSRFERKG